MWAWFVNIEGLAAGMGWQERHVAKHEEV